MFFDGRARVGIENLNHPRAFIDYSQTIDDVYENLKDYNPTKKEKLLIVFDDMITDVESNKELSFIVTKLFLRETKLNISLSFISQSFFKVPKFIRLNATHFIMTILNKR